MRGSMLLVSVALVACGGQVAGEKGDDASADVHEVVDSGLVDSFFRVDVEPDVPSSDTGPAPFDTTSFEDGVRPDFGPDSPCRCPVEPTFAAECVGCDGLTCDYCDGGKQERWTCDGSAWSETTIGTCSCSEGGTTGKPCSSDGACDVVHDGVNVCLRTADPDAVCIGTSCDLSVAACDCTGLCVPTTPSGSACLPRCTFDGTGSAPAGCLWRDACIPYTIEIVDGRLLGYGICLGGCHDDVDCAGGQRCWKSAASCVPSGALPGTERPPGTPCTSADSTATPPNCFCVTTNATLDAGYCTSACFMRTAYAACPSGFTCDAMLPHDPFPVVPLGIEGVCAKNCATDADCAAYPGSSCVQHAGTGDQKTCETRIK